MTLILPIVVARLSMRIPLKLRNILQTSTI